MSSAAPAPANREYNVRKPTISKGHDAVLKALKEGHRQATIITMAGEKVDGVITGFDKFTITLATVQPGGPAAPKIRRVFYKHGIEQFYGEEPAASSARS